MIEKSSLAPFTGFVLDEVAPGFTPREVLELAEMEIAAGPEVRTME